MKQYFTRLALSLLLLPQVAFSTGNDNPTGVTGEYNGSITTAGTYDPYTGNGKRFVTDLTVTANVGAPLKWTRVLNTRHGQMSAPFGQGGTWKHSYQWGLWLRPYRPYKYYENQYEGPDGAVSYPDGRTMDLEVGSDGTYAQKNGFQPLDRIEHVGGSNYDLLLADGGRVKFEPAVGSTSTNDLVAARIVDPYGQTTVLERDSSNRLWRIIEPAGRYLQITYHTYSYTYRWNNVTYTKNVDVIIKVEAYDGRGNLMEWVDYSYTEEIVNQLRYYNLTQVNYADNTQATYSYYPVTGHSDGMSMIAGRIKSCNDVRYAGAMSRIQYDYMTPSDTYRDVAVGQITREKNLSTGQVVSEVIYAPNYPPSPATYAASFKRTGR